MQRRTHTKQRRTECPLNVLQSYNRLSKTTTRIMSKSFENFRRHFLKINFRYNVRFLTSTATCIYICQDGGAVGFVEFTKLLFALSSLAQPLKQVRSIPEYFFVILNQRKAWAGRFREETVGKRTGLITRWPLRRLLFTRLEIIFVTIPSFTKRTKVAQKVFQKSLTLLISLNKSFFWVKAPNVTETERPFYDLSQR